MNQRILAAATLLSLTSGAASASSLTISGSAGLAATYTWGTLDDNTVVYQQSFNVTGSVSSALGIVRLTNTGYALVLNLDNFTFGTSSAAPVSVSIHIVQDYLLSLTPLSATASRDISGTTNGTLGTARIQHSSTHNATAVAPLDTGTLTSIGNYHIASPNVPIGVAGSLYTIDSTYTFTLSRGASGTAGIQMYNGGWEEVAVTTP